MICHPRFLSCTFKIVCKATSDKQLALTPTLSGGEGAFSLRPGGEGPVMGEGGVTVLLAT